MNGPSFQRRTDDLYLLKTRNIIYENVDGSFPTPGAIGYITNTVGAVGWSGITTDTSGNLTVPGTATLGKNGAVEVSGITGTLLAKNDVVINGTLVANNTVQTYTLILENLTETNVESQLYDDNDVNGKETLFWKNDDSEIEPISGWTAKIEPSQLIFRTVDTTDLSGATLVLAQQMNALLTLFLNRGVFVNTITPNTTLAAVFNTDVSILFSIYGPTGNFVSSAPFSITGDKNVAVPYNQIAASLKTTYMDVSYNPVDSTYGTMSFILDASYTMIYTDLSTNGTAQLFMNHIGFGILQTGVAYPNLINTSMVGSVEDLFPLMPPTPTAAPTVAVGYPHRLSCRINIPPKPTTPVIAIQKVCIYWCVSGSSFQQYPNAIIPTTQTTYDITGLTANTEYIVGLSYRSLYDESPISNKQLYFITTVMGPALASDFSSEIKVYSVELTEDVNWLATPSYGVSVVNYAKPYLTNVKFTVATVFSSVWSGTLSDLTQISQIQSVSIDFYAGSSSADARFFTGTNPMTNIVYAGGGPPVEAQYGDAVGAGASMTIYPDVDGLDMLHEIFNAADDGAIDVAKNMTFGWYCTQGGLRNCEMTRFNVVYTV